MLSAMEQDVTEIERAFQLAKSGSCPTVRDIVVKLRQEGYASSQIEGRSLHKQLVGLIEAARDGCLADPRVRSAPPT